MSLPSAEALHAAMLVPGRRLCCPGGEQGGRGGRREWEGSEREGEAEGKEGRSDAADFDDEQPAGAAARRGLHMYKHGGIALGRCSSTAWTRQCPADVNG
ncbi:unnamed protein product [Prorocentrum cordatum]|uniref:Uncharacterized protein n=1 Tax=Prorocentrum cordatum TaxID=2364126 RepID=A0ABN9PW32_9DINO|nr:unnamed protein product [Polarella glacialis]